MKDSFKTIYLVAGTVVVISAVVGFGYMISQSQKNDTKNPDQQSSIAVTPTIVVTPVPTKEIAGTPDKPINNTTRQDNMFKELIKEDTVVGTGAEATKGKTITVNYTGKLLNGTVFDSSVGKQPFTFVLGAGQVIQGWDQGFDGMKVGGKRTLKIPAAMAYGERDLGVIPANSDLIFEVEMLQVK